MEGTIYSIQDISNNFTKNGNDFTYQSLTRNVTFEGQTVVVNYILPYVVPTGTTNNNGN